MKQFVLGSLCFSMLLLFVFFQLNIDDVDVHEAKQLNDFTWLKNSNYLKNFVKPDRDTELFLPSSLNGTEERQLIACFVLSSPKNDIERRVIRQTWGSLIKPLFIVGKSDNETMRMLTAESLLFNDIIVEDFYDSYLNLTLKTAFAMKHFLKYYQNSTYFLKIDDDVYLNVDNLKSLINDKTVPKDAIIGRKVTYLKPHREKENKLYIPYWLYEDDTFPPYLDGPAYLIPGYMIPSIFELAMKIPFFTIEDAFFVGEVAGRRLNYTLLGNKKFRTMKAPYVSPCLHNRYITVHKTLPAETQHLWQQLQTGYRCSLLERIQSFYWFIKDMIL